MFTSLTTLAARAQGPNESETGAWYIYVWSMKFNENRFGMQGDFQYRNWNIMGDLEQLLLRAAATYSPRQGNATFAAGYAFVLSGAYGPNDKTAWEHRPYQEMVLRQKVGSRFYFLERLRFEQRFIQYLNFRTRYRFNFMLNVPFNRKNLHKGAFFLSLYAEIFLNGERNIGRGITVEIFDRARLFASLGYSITDHLRVQLGYMQQVTDLWSKGQLQIGMVQNFHFK